MSNKASKGSLGQSHIQLAEVLEIFSKIDLKIIDLHKCSSDDFLALNAALKDNYKKATLIVDKTNNTFEKIGESGNLNTIKLAKQEIQKLNKLIFSLCKKIDNSLEKLENVAANLNMAPIPLNNFIQNLCVLKLLFSNIKLTDSFFDNKNKYFNKSESTKIENTINKIKKDCQPFEEQVASIQSKIKLLYDSLFSFKTKKLNNFTQSIEGIIHNLELIEKHNINALESKEHINTLSKQCSANVESIITNLQYHDIIRQKMEHVQKSHQIIIGELNGFEKAVDDEAKEAKLLSYVVQIPQISEIQTAQLLHANKEFQHAIDQITGKMNEIGQNMRHTARIYDSIATFKNQGEDLNIEIIDTVFEKLNEEFLDSSNIADSLNLDLSSIFNSILNLKESLVNVDLADNSIEKLVIEKINSNNLICSSNEETATQAQQLIKLYSDNRFEKNKLKEIFKHTIEQLAYINIVVTNLCNENQGIPCLKVISDRSYNKMLNVKDVYKYLHESNAIIQDNSKEIVQKNKDAIKEAKYYKYFEESIDEIIGNFNTISNMVKSGKLSDYKSEDSENSLKQLEEYYTMKTERMIHGQTISNILDKHQNQEEDDDDSKGNDVEFF